MPKYINPQELAEIVCGLLVKPELLGELDEASKHQAFMKDIGEVVAEHCGGCIAAILMLENEDGDVSDVLKSGYMTTPDNTPRLLVDPDDALPSLTQNVWMFAHRDGWLENIKASETDSPDQMPEHSQVSRIRHSLQRLLIPATTTWSPKPEHVVRMTDWRRDDETLPQEDLQTYSVTASLGINASLEVHDENGELCFTTLFEIDQGVPALHIGTGENMQLHIRAAHGGFVLTPDDSSNNFKKAPVDRYSYDSPALLLSTN